MTGPAQYEDLVADRVMNKKSEVGEPTDYVNSETTGLSERDIDGA
jgi:hypothetical protein